MNNNLEFENANPHPNSIEDNHPRTNYGEGFSEGLPILKPIKYEDTPEHKSTIEYGRYLVVRKDGKKHLETFNGTGWAYNHKSIEYYYLPKID